MQIASKEFVTPQRKCQFLQFVTPYFELPQLTRLGFETSLRSHKTAKEWHARHGKVTNVPLQQGGHKPNPQLTTDIAEFCYDNSRTVANRYCTKHDKNFRYLDGTVVCLFNKYNSETGRQPCLEFVFGNPVMELKISIKASSEDDLCSYCEAYKVIEK